MANIIIPKGAGKKRLGLREVLDNQTEEERLERNKELAADVEAAKNYRWESPAVQARQDEHLSLYKAFVLKIKDGIKNTDDVAEEQWKDRLFPTANFPKMVDLMAQFLNFVLRHAAPDDEAAETISWSTLCTYRDSMMFWAERYYKKADQDLPKAELYRELTNRMRYIWDHPRKPGPG